MTAVAVRGMTEVEARASVARARTHLQGAADEVLAQVEGRAWEALGYPDWPTMREAEYRGPAVLVAHAERPAIVGRLHAAGLTQREIGATLGVAQSTVNRDLKIHMNIDSRTNARGQTRPRTYKKRTPTQKDIRSGATRWSKAVQRVSKGCLTDELTDDELEELLGAATYLANYCRGVLTTRKALR